MANKNKKAFTLAELLAVIVILAVILVIAVPSIMDTIKESRRGALASSAKLIASSAESAYISNQTLGIEKNITCSDVAQLTSEDYTSCIIKFVDGKAKVTIVGQGKFEGMSVCSGTKENAEVVDKCPTAVEKIESLATESNTEGLELTSDGNIRYTGSSPKNYIKFNDEDWRIIGTFTVTTASGKTEKLLKIVKDTQFSTSMSWDSSASSVNSGYGVNEWSQADLMTELNTLYLNQGSGTCFNGSSNTSTTCDFTSTGINSASRNMVEEVVWNTGTFSWGTTPVLTAYNAERGTRTGKECSSGIYCNDSVTRTTTWTGKVGLIYPSDYGYASTDTSCRANINDNTNYSCENTNWLHSGSTYWTISRIANSYRATLSWFVRSDGFVDFDSAYRGFGVRPSIYLKSDVSITSGDGSSSATAYQISMN